MRPGGVGGNICATSTVSEAERWLSAASRAGHDPYISSILPNNINLITYCQVQ